VTVAVALVVTNDAGASHVPWTTVMALPLCLTGVLGLAWTINHVTYFLSMYSRILPGMCVTPLCLNTSLSQAIACCAPEVPAGLCGPTIHFRCSFVRSALTPVSGAWFPTVPAVPSPIPTYHHPWPTPPGGFYRIAATTPWCSRGATPPWLRHGFLGVLLLPG
jgi:hypothetical protein